jgi:hypothetical protein
VVKGVTQGKLDISMSVDGKVFYSESLGEEFEYDQIGKYPIKKDAPYGKKPVIVKGILHLDEAMTKAYGKSKITAQKKVSFEIKEGIYNSDLFIGTWNCIGQFISHSGATEDDIRGIPKQSRFQLIITKKEDNFLAEIPGSSRRHSAKIETEYIIDTVHPDGNTLTIRAEDLTWAYGDGKKALLSKTFENFELKINDDGTKLDGVLEQHHYTGLGKDYDTQINKITGIRIKK